VTRPTKGLADAPSADAPAPIPLLRSRLHSGWREWIYTRILELDASWTGSSIAAPTRPCRTGCRPRRGSPPSPTPSANGPHPCRCGSEPTGLVRGPCRRGRPGRLSGPAVLAARVPGILAEAELVLGQAIHEWLRRGRPRSPRHRTGPAPN